MTTTRRRRIKRGDFYPRATRTAENGKRYAVEPSAPFFTLEAAKRWLDAQGLPGYVQQWSDRTQSRTIVTNRDADGRYWVTNPFTGEKTYAQEEN